MTVLPAGKFYLDIKKIVLVPDAIIVTTTCASWTIYFESKFYQMDLVGPLIICFHSRDAPVVG